MAKSKKYPFYVTMTDRFMSGWGMAKGKTNKLVLPARSYEEALTVQRNAQDRSEMKYINVVMGKPRYNPRFYEVSYHGENDYNTWYRKDRPFRKK